MKGLNKLALVVAIAAASSAHAEMVAMDDSAMSATTGQAGLTIDVNSAEISIGEIDYKDAGFIAIKDVLLTGSSDAFGSGQGDGIFNNVQIKVDVAGSGETFRLGHEYLSQAAGILDGAVSDNYEDQTIGDGDLVIAIKSIDLIGGIQTVDYGLQIGQINLGDSNQTVGAVDGTVLMSDLNLAGFLGPVDIVVHNSDAGMNISAYFNAEGSLNMPFMAVSTDLAIHNSRGDDLTWIDVQDEGHSLAHIQMNISKGTNASGTEGLAFALEDFSADIDLTNVRLGSAPSIGDIYITDFHMTADTLVYGH